VIFYTQSAARAFAAATLLGSIVLADPCAIAAGHSAAPERNSAPRVLAQAATSPATTRSATATDKTDPVEARIRELHSKLHITAAQQTQWDNLVAVMRDNAKAMMDLQKQRGQDASGMNAVEAVKSYQSVIEAHKAGMAKFVPAFQALYDSMSDAQKKTADAMFSRKVRTSAAKKST
jgi:hypothetical protein